MDFANQEDNSWADKGLLSARSVCWLSDGRDSFAVGEGRTVVMAAGEFGGHQQMGLNTRVETEAIELYAWSVRVRDLNRQSTSQ